MKKKKDQKSQFLEKSPAFYMTVKNHQISGDKSSGMASLVISLSNFQTV